MTRKKYRSQAGIILSILEILVREGPIPPTRLATYANLPYDRLKIILASMEDKGLIKRVDEGYIITDQGYEALSVLRKAHSYLEYLGFRL